jgi:hypothetical protein
VGWMTGKIKNFLFSKSSRTALGFTQPLIQIIIIIILVMAGKTPKKKKRELK